jgi:hypothetical protein
MPPLRLLAVLALLTGVAACGDVDPSPTPIAASPISLPGERAQSAALSAPPDEWASPRQTTQAAASRP